MMTQTRHGWLGIVAAFGIAVTAQAVTPIGSLPFTANTPGETYVLTGNLVVSGTGITIAADDVTIDGAGFSITGDGTGVGVLASGRDNPTITDLTIDSFNFGIQLITVGTPTVTGNTIVNNTNNGMDTSRASNPVFSGNTITGNGGSGIDMINAGPTGGTVVNNTINGNGSSVSDYGIKLVSAGLYLIATNSMTGNADGIFIQTGGSHTIEDNDITGGTYGIRVLPRGDGGFHLLTISRNIVLGAAIGLWLDSPGNLVEDNVFGNGGTGIYLPRQDNDFIGNVADGNSSYGLRHSGRANNLYQGNSFSDNGIYGVWVAGLASANLVFDGNTVDGNATGGFLLQDGPVNTTFSNNSVSSNGEGSNDYAFRLQGASDGNTYTANIVTNNMDFGFWFVTIGTRVPDGNLIYNNVINNTRNYVRSGTVGSNTWNVAATAGPNVIGCPTIGGNFWGTPTGTGHSETCTDANADNFCDTVFANNGQNVDALPLVVCELGVPCASLADDLLAELCDALAANPATSVAGLLEAANGIIDDLLDGTVISDLSEDDCRAALLALVEP